MSSYSFPNLTSQYQLEESCPKAACTGTVQVRVCRGTTKAENKGFLYRVCNRPANESHFLGWVGNTRQNADEAARNLSLSGLSFQQVLMRPSTPAKASRHPSLPSTSPIRPETPKSGISKPPTAKAPAITSRSYAATYSNPDTRHDTSLDALPVPATDINTFDGGSDSTSGSSTTGFDGKTLPAGTPAASGSSTPSVNGSGKVYGREHTKVVVRKGKAVTVCNGPVCQQRDAVRSCSKCTHAFCKKCCIQFVKDGGARCLHQTHQKADAEDSSSDDDKATHRPLRQDHYDAKEQAQKQWESKTNQLVQRKLASDSLKTIVTIIFWKDDASDPETVMIRCPTFPVFELSQCSPKQLSAIGCDADDQDFLVETFDLGHGANGRWVKHSLSTPRDASLYPTLLYRASGVSATAVDLSDEVQKIRSHGKSQKGPVLIQAASSSKRPPVISIVTPTVSPSQSDDDDVSDSTPPPSIMLPPPPKPEASTSQSTTKRKGKEDQDMSRKKQKTKIEHVDIDLTEAGSKHADWPLKYSLPMMEGFERMESMGSNGRIEDRFKAVFDTDFPGSRRTFFEHRDCWEAAGPALRERYRKSGMLWKALRKDVADKYGGKGLIPSRGSGRKKVRSTVKVMTEPRVKVEAESSLARSGPTKNEVIVIDSDSDSDSGMKIAPLD